MIIGVPKESAPDERRVATYPGILNNYLKDKHQVLVESGAGIGATYSDEAYSQAGAQIITDLRKLYSSADVILKVQPPRYHDALKTHEADLIREGALYLGFLSPFSNVETVQKFLSRKITGFAMEMVPRITRAQSMDALSAMATVAGYKSVLMAADFMPKMFPLMMTAAGTIPPAVVLILGAGVAGLQAIATAKRLGARVEAFDPRPAVKEQIKSLGATFIEMEVTEEAEGKGGYAKQMSEEFLRQEREVIASRFAKVDVVICTAQVFGKKAPVLITKEMVEQLRPGSVIIDLAAEQGGNCELTEAGKTISFDGVNIIGTVNLPSKLPIDASQMYSRILSNFFKLLYPKPDAQPNFEDEVIRGTCVTRDGNLVNEQVKAALSL